MVGDVVDVRKTPKTVLIALVVCVTTWREETLRLASAGSIRKRPRPDQSLRRIRRQKIHVMRTPRVVGCKY